MSNDARAAGHAEIPVEVAAADLPELAALRAAVDALAGVDPRALVGCEAVRTMVQEMARLESVVCRQADAFAAGAIGVEHVDVLNRARGRSRIVAQAYARDEAMLVGWATTEVFDRFRHRVDERLQCADEGAAERHAERLHERRRLHLSQSLEDRWFLDALLDPISGEIVHEVLDRIDRELFEIDWAATRTALGCEPVAADLPRTPAQRRADALVEMARRAGAVPAGARLPVPLFTVLVGEATFAKVCELASGRIVPPGSVASWLDEAVIERIVFDGPDRVIGVSHRRAFRGALRRAIEVRDGTCTDHYCNCPAHRSQVDHVVPHAAGGVISLDNGRLLCGFHNRRRSRRRRPPDEPA